MGPQDREVVAIASALDDQRTAIALVKAQLTDDKIAWWELVRGSEDLRGLLAATTSLAASLAEILGLMTGVPSGDALDRLIAEFGKRDPGPNDDVEPDP